jgi:hypothetical protein
MRSCASSVRIGDCTGASDLRSLHHLKLDDLAGEAMDRARCLDLRDWHTSKLPTRQDAPERSHQPHGLVDQVLGSMDLGLDEMDLFGCQIAVHSHLHERV